MAVRHGVPPYLEASSKGDKRFSAFYAKVEHNGKLDTIENHYQAAKVFADGSTGLTWRQAKGKQAVNMKEVSSLYFDLWVKYILENRELLPVLANATGISDMFGQPGHNCQATVLWEIRRQYINHLAKQG